jgi:predicted RNase H-like HicB family nuclease
MLHKLRYALWPEEGSYVVQCLDVDVATQAESAAEAIVQLKEALRLYFDGMTPITPLLPEKVVFGEIECSF